METPKILMLASQLANLGCDQCGVRVEWEVSTEESETGGDIILTGVCECRTYRFRVYILEMIGVAEDKGLSALFGNDNTESP